MGVNGMDGDEAAELRGLSGPGLLVIRRCMRGKLPCTHTGIELMQRSTNEHGVRN